MGGRVYLVDLALDEANESTDAEPASLALLTNPAARRDIPGYASPLHPRRYCTDIISIIIF